MAGFQGFFDAIFGRLFANGTEVALRAGLNVVSPLTVTADAANNRNTLGFSPTPTGLTSINGTKLAAPTQGADLTDANETLTVAGGANRMMNAGTTTVARDKTLGASGAADGVTITVAVYAQGHNVVFKDDAGSPNTLHTVTAGAKQVIDFPFDNASGRFKRGGWKPLT